jgi:hypothetical protein
VGRGVRRGAQTLPRRVHPRSPSFHQPLDRATGHTDAFTVHLPPDLVGAVDLHVGYARPAGFWPSVPGHPLGACTAQFWVALTGRIAPVARRGNLQDLADRLDPIRVPVRSNEVDQDLSRRSSSAWAKNALASLQDLVGPAQFLDLALQGLDAGAFFGLVRPSRTPVSISAA